MKDVGALRRAAKNFSRRKMRGLMVIIALGFSMAIMISIPAGIMANQEATQHLTENFNSTITSMQEEINKTATLIECRTSGRSMSSGMPMGMPPFGQEERFINETVIADIASMDGIKDIVRFLEQSSEETTSETISEPGGRTFTISRPLYTIMGVSLNSSLISGYSILPANITAGRNLCDGDSRVLIMSSNLSDYLGLQVGDKIEVYGESFTVVGICEVSRQGRMETRVVYMSIFDAQTITGNSGNVSRLDIYAEDVSDVDVIADYIEAVYPELYVTTYQDRLESLSSMQTMYSTTLENAESTLAQTQSLATQEIIVVIAATSLIILFVMLYTVRERTREIGTLKALGFSNWNIMSQFMLEGILISLVAGVAGIAIGSLGAPFLSSLLLPHVSLFGGSSSGGFRPGFGSTNPVVIGSETAAATLSLPLVLLAFGAAVLLGALGSLYPAWRAAKIKPAEAMRYE
ncbi:ABC transporter permease [Candidatus Bathyarchaeota archaeon]|nr:ABC transporter permease [Candidatus Bathyarchaeota archaeon]